MKITKHKKAIATSLVVDFWSIILYFLVFLIVYAVILFMTRAPYDVKVEQLKESKTMELLNILRTPIDAGSGTMTVAEYLAKYDSDNSLDSQTVKDAIKAALQKVNLYSKDNFNCISFDFEDLGKKIILKPDDNPLLPRICEDPQKMVEINFPAREGRIVNATYYAK